MDVELREAIGRLDRWIEENGWAGWDPYDLKALPLALALQGSGSNAFCKKILRVLLFRVFETFPLLCRKALGVEKQVNAKAMGLFLAAFALLYRSTRDESYLRKAYECREWLLDHPAEGYSGYGWGYPFDWHSQNFIPAHTPSSVVTSVVGDGFFQVYRCTGEEEDLDVCRRICEFFVEELSVTASRKGAICYSYTPVDDYQVHNANLFVGEFLTRVGREVGHSGWTDQGLACGRFALTEQFPEGYLSYWGQEQIDTYGGGKVITDHYHSGFEIRALYGIWKNTGESSFEAAYRRYFEWYWRQMFSADGLPQLTPGNVYPIDIHGCAEAMLCLATLVSDHEEAATRLEHVFRWVLEVMEYEPGQYRYLVKRTPVGLVTTDIPMIRWGQAWILRAYAQMLTLCRL